MDLHPELEQLLGQTEATMREAVENCGNCPAFALVLRVDGTVDRIEPVQADPTGHPIADLLTALLPLGRAGAIKASAMCMTMPAAGGLNAAVIDLEHKDAQRVLAIIPYKKRAFLGWSFSPAQLKRDSPKLFGTASAPSVDIKHAEFQLRLGGDWKQVHSSDHQQFNFESKANKTNVIVSILPANVPKGKFLEAARALADARQSAELQADPSRKIVFGDKWVELKENGHAGHVAYAGYDDRGNIFRFMGWVTQVKVFSFWVCTETTDNDLSKRVFDEVFSGLRLVVP